jgi:hypothetical protein
VERLLSQEQDENVVAQFEKFTVEEVSLTELHGLEARYLNRQAA